MKLYYEKDADLGHLKGKKIAVIGYGSQGHAHALNLKESGLDVMVGLRRDSASIPAANKAGLEVAETSVAARSADLIMILAPDQSQPEIFENDILPFLKNNGHKTLAFAHGFNIHFGQIVPPPNVDVIMVAPKGPGHLVRSVYQEGGGVPCLMAVFQDVSGKASDVALAYAMGIGGARAGVLETTFREETETDLFGEQAVLCGGATELVKAGFKTLVEAGYQPEVAYFECMHELKLIVDLFYQGGISYMYHSVSDTAEFGGMTSGPKVIDERTQETMREILRAIQQGEFAREWVLENKANRPVLNALRREHHELEIENVGRRLREMMPWVKPKQF